MIRSDGMPVIAGVIVGLIIAVAIITYVENDKNNREAGKVYYSLVENYVQQYPALKKAARKHLDDGILTRYEYSDMKRLYEEMEIYHIKEKIRK